MRGLPLVVPGNGSQPVFVTHAEDVADQLASVVAGAYKKECGPGDVIISQGDMEADSFYVVKSGEFKVSVADSNAGDDKTTTGQIVADLKF